MKQTRTVLRGAGIGRAIDLVSGGRFGSRRVRACDRPRVERASRSRNMAARWKRRNAMSGLRTEGWQPPSRWVDLQGNTRQRAPWGISAEEQESAQEGCFASRGLRRCEPDGAGESQVRLVQAG